MRCDDFHAVLAEYLAGELDTPCVLEAERHLAACDACRGTAASLGAAQRAVASLAPTPFQAAATVQSLRPPDGHVPKRSRGPLVRALALAASLALAFVLGALMQRSRSPAVTARETPPAVSRVQDAYVRTAQRLPNESRMTWGLLSVARR